MGLVWVTLCGRSYCNVAVFLADVSSTDQRPRLRHRQGYIHDSGALSSSAVFPMRSNIDDKTHVEKHHGRHFSRTQQSPCGNVPQHRTGLVMLSCYSGLLPDYLGIFQNYLVTLHFIIISYPLPCHGGGFGLSRASQQGVLFRTSKCLKIQRKMIFLN